MLALAPLEPAPVDPEVGTQQPSVTLEVDNKKKLHLQDVLHHNGVVLGINT